MARSRSDPSKPDTAARILEVAAELFAAKGYAATTTREIAETAEIERASLYYHITSKETLLYEICHASLVEALSVVVSVDTALPPIPRLTQLIELHMATILKNRAANLTMLLDMRSLTGPRLDTIVAMRAEYEHSLITWVEEGQRDGSITAQHPPRVIALALLNMLNWTLIWYSEGGGSSPSELSELYSSVFFDGALPRG